MNMGSCLEMNNTGKNTTVNPALKAIPEVRTAFDDLVSKDEFIKSSEIILKYFASLMPPGQEHEELCEDAKYVVKRLITSLSSQRMFIRQGCYAIFQVLLQLYPQILTFTWSFIGNFYKDCSKKSLAARNFGLALALGAIIRSGLAMEEKLCLKDIIKKFLKMNDSKYVVGPIVGQFLVNLLSMYKDQIISQTIWRECQQSLLADMETLPTFILWLRVLIAREEYIKDLPDVPKSFQKNTYDKSTYKYILSVLQKLFTDGVNITPMVEDYFKSLILYQPQPNNSDEDNLSHFFSTAVTPALSPELKTNVLLFNISQVALSHLTSKKSIETVLSPKLMEMLISSCKSDIAEVSASARGLFSAILQLLMKNKEMGSKIQIAVMKRLVSTSRNFNVDEFTKTTILQQASNNLSAESVIGFTKFLVKNSRNLTADKSSVSKKFKEVLPICQWINRLLGHSTLTSVDQRSWKAEQVSHLFRIAFLSGFNNLSQHQMLKDCFLKGLSQCSGNIEFQASFIEEIVDCVRQLVNEEEFKELSRDHVNLFISISDKLKELPEEGSNTLSSADLAVFKILYGYISLGVFIDSKDSEELVEEIKQCYKRASGKKNKKEKSSEKIDENYEEPEWREVVMDLLLSLLSKEESFWRKVATVIFVNICQKIKPSVLSILTDVINPEKGESILEDKTDEDAMDHSSIIDGDDVDDLDTSMEVDAEEVSGSEEEEEESNDDDDDDEDIDDQDEEKDADKDKLDIFNLRKKMQEIVGLPTDTTVELDSVPQEELDNLDKKLGALITQYVALSNKRKKKIKLDKDETALMCLRTRVCDLLETLIKEAPSLEHILQVIKPILMAINEALEDKLQIHFLAKLRSLIADVSKVKTFVKSTSISHEELATYLNDILSMANKFSTAMIADVNQCCTFLVRSEQYLNADDEKKSNVVMKAYTDYLERAFSETSVCIFDGPIHLENVSLEMILKLLSEVIFKNSTKAPKKKKGFEMLKEILNNEKAMNKISSNSLSLVLEKIQREIIKAFDDVNETEQIQSNYLIMLIETLKTLKKVLVSNHEMEKLFEWEKVTKSITSFCERVPLQGFKLLKQAIQSFTNIKNLKLKSNEGKKNNSLEDRDKKLSKKKRKLKQLEENMESEELNIEKEEKKVENVNKKAKRKMEEGNEVDLEEEVTVEKKKKKKKNKKHQQQERIQKNVKRLCFNDKLEDFSFANIDLETEI